MKTSEERFFAKVNKTKTCWLWIGSQVSGRSPEPYGQFWLDNKTQLAHRVSYKLFVGEIPLGKTIDHICRRPLCVNPEHLRPLTVKENIMAGNGIAVINKNKIACINGHPYTEENTLRSNNRRWCKICKHSWDKKRYDRNR